MTTVRDIQFRGALGAPLSAILELPEGHARGYAIVAHCFTCTSRTHPTSAISPALDAHGYAVLRFDFTGLALDPALTVHQLDALLRIADKCPVHRTLTGEVRILTQALHDEDAGDVAWQQSEYEPALLEGGSQWTPLTSQ